jgi:hypothetical protein
MQSTKEHRRYDILFLWSDGVKTRKIYSQKNAVQYGGNCMNHRKVYGLVGKIQRKMDEF